MSSCHCLADWNCAKVVVLGRKQPEFAARLLGKPSRRVTVDCSRSAPKAIFGFSAASIFRLVFFMVRSVYQNGTTT
jgi:hypothetical protein